jgi:large subunit ribosomal protein L35
MPKMKPHSGMSKRTKVTGSGKIMAQSANHVHKLEHKSGSQKRRLTQDVVIAKSDTKRVKKMLGR